MRADSLNLDEGGDLAFLRALYEADLEESLPLERSNIHGNMIPQVEHN
jgi:hypothetical protein